MHILAHNQNHEQGTSIFPLTLTPITRDAFDLKWISVKACMTSLQPIRAQLLNTYAYVRIMLQRLQVMHARVSQSGYIPESLYKVVTEGSRGCKKINLTKTSNIINEDKTMKQYNGDIILRENIYIVQYSGCTRPNIICYKK